MKLPFLQSSESRWPMSKEPEERVVNASHDDKLQDHLVDELLMALERKNHQKLREVLVALVDSFRNEEMPDVQ
jgi:hypothetical protein